jgi:hypothetical protein
LAPFNVPPWQTYVSADGYQDAVIEAGRSLVAAMHGHMGNRLYWEVSLVEMVHDA